MTVSSLAARHHNLQSGSLVPTLQELSIPELGLLLPFVCRVRLLGKLLYLPKAQFCLQYGGKSE